MSKTKLHSRLQIPSSVVKYYLKKFTFLKPFLTKKPKPLTTIVTNYVHKLCKNC